MRLFRSEAHVDTWLADYARGRLATSLDQEIEAHLLTCDLCFAALVAEVVMDTRAEAKATPA